MEKIPSPQKNPLSGLCEKENSLFSAFTHAVSRDVDSILLTILLLIILLYEEHCRNIIIPRYYRVILPIHH